MNSTQPLSADLEIWARKTFGSISYQLESLWTRNAINNFI